MKRGVVRLRVVIGTMGLLLSGFLCGPPASADADVGGGGRTQAGANLSNFNDTLSAPVPTTWSTAKGWTSSAVKSIDSVGKIAEVTGKVQLTGAAMTTLTAVALALPTGSATIFLGAAPATGLAVAGVGNVAIGKGLQSVSKNVGPLAEAVVDMFANRGDKARAIQSDLADRATQDWKDAGLDPAQCRQGILDASKCMDALSSSTLDAQQAAQALIDHANGTDWWKVDAQDGAYLENKAAGDFVKYVFDKAATSLAQEALLDKESSELETGIANSIGHTDEAVDKMIERAPQLPLDGNGGSRKPVVSVAPRRAGSGYPPGPSGPGGSANAAAAAPARTPPSPDCAVLADTQASRALMARDSSTWSALMAKCGL